MKRSAAPAMAVLLAFGGPAHAVRPFVTEDASIEPQGQLEVEAWPLLLRTQGELHYCHYAWGALSITDWWKAGGGGGIGVEAGGDRMIDNPVLQTKVLFWAAADDSWLPGFAAVAGVTLPWGQGEVYDDALGPYVFVPLTWQPLGGQLTVHLNAGVVSAFRGAHRPSGSAHSTVRPMAGLGAELEVGAKFVLMAELYTGDPQEPLGPTRAFQFGARWPLNDQVRFNFLVGAEPPTEDGLALDEPWDTWAQFGLRLLIDVYSDPRRNEARGMFERALP